MDEVGEEDKKLGFRNTEIKSLQDISKTDVLYTTGFMSLVVGWTGERNGSYLPIWSSLFKSYYFLEQAGKLMMPMLEVMA